MKKARSSGSERWYFNQIRIWIIAVLLIITFTIPVWGADDQSKSGFFKNITIDTLGSQKYDMKTNIITNIGHARIIVDDAVIEADSLTYDGAKKLILANGNVRVISGNITLTANCLTLDNNTGWLDATGAVQLVSLTDNYRSETIHYNLQKRTGNIGPFQGVVKGSVKDFHVYGQSAVFDNGTVIISPAILTRSPREDYPDYVFAAKRMVIKGKSINMEKVVMKILGIPVLYLPNLPLSGVEVPHINLSANQGNERDLTQVISESSSTVSSAKSDNVHISPNYDVDINTGDKTSTITVGRIYQWKHYSDEIDMNFDSEGIFYLTDIYHRDWDKYNLTIDGKNDLGPDPKQELGVAFTKNAWQTDWGNWQVQLVTRFLSKKSSDYTYQGVYGGYRIDYQLNPDLNYSYLYLDDISGTKTDWDRLEKVFLIINDYRLGGNSIYDIKMPLSPHYYLTNTGSYNLRYGSWTSQVLGLMWEVDCIRVGFGWDFAKQLAELHFHLNY